MKKYLEQVNDGWICYVPNFLEEKESVIYFNYLLEVCEFKTNVINIFGKKIEAPRKESFHSSCNKSYGYSGSQLEIQNYNDTLFKIQHEIEKFSNQKFNSVLVNLYRNERDSNGWHSDNEKELGKNPIIASLSLGCSRRFQLKHQSSKEKLSFQLNNGDLFIMGGKLQHHWKHQVPKEKFDCSPRINLTFRYIF